MARLRKMPRRKKSIETMVRFETRAWGKSIETMVRFGANGYNKKC